MFSLFFFFKVDTKVYDGYIVEILNLVIFVLRLILILPYN